MNLVDLAERGLLPDRLIRLGIRRLNRERLAECAFGTDAERRARFKAFIDGMRDGPIAPVPEKANEQHYEVPPSFYKHVLGPHRKYSCCHYDERSDTLAQAEEKALALVCERARIEDGHSILELGCGWGSLTLWLAASYPGCRIHAVSNAHGQREFIEDECRRRSLENVRVSTCDMNEFDPGERFDRVLSVEMFEHMRNWPALLQRVHSWLNPSGLLFLHVFCHRRHAYEFSVAGESDWMAKHFFTGGIMPSEALVNEFDQDLAVRDSWFVNGNHYKQTANAWLDNLDHNRAEVLAVLGEVYGHRNAPLWLQRWRMFFMACAELFGHRDGTEWGVSHYLLAPCDTMRQPD